MTPLVLFQPFNSRYWGVLSARTIPDILAWADTHGMIYVDRDPVVFVEFNVATTDGTPVNDDALELLRASGRERFTHVTRETSGSRASAALALAGNPYMAAVYGPMIHIETGREGTTAQDVADVVKVLAAGFAYDG